MHSFFCDVFGLPVLTGGGGGEPAPDEIQGPGESKEFWVSAKASVCQWTPESLPGATKRPAVVYDDAGRLRAQRVEGAE